MTPTIDHPALRLWADTMAATRENYSETPQLRAETRVRLFAHALEATGYRLAPVRPSPEEGKDSPMLTPDALSALNEATGYHAWRAEDARPWARAFLAAQDHDALAIVAADALRDDPVTYDPRTRLGRLGIAACAVGALLGVPASADAPAQPV